MKFHKMHSLGNDFVIIENSAQIALLDIKKIAHRKYGLGCDQLIVLNDSKNALCNMDVYNQDGSKALMCGNAAKCVAFLIHRNTKKQSFNIEISKKWIANVNFDATSPYIYFPLDYEMKEISIAGINCVYIKLLNDHLIFESEYSLEDLHKVVQDSNRFLDGINISKIRYDEVNSQNIYAQTWERGVGPTHACGSAAMACAIVGYTKGVNSVFAIKMPGGDLQIAIQSEYIQMNIDANYVCEGILDLNYALIGEK